MTNALVTAQMALEGMSAITANYAFALVDETANGIFIRKTVAARAAIPRISTRHGGRGGAMVFLSSAMATLGGAGEFVMYSTSKGAIDTLTIGLAKEAAAQGVRVNAVNPGLIETELHAAAGMPDRVARMSAGVPLGRGGTAEEVAEAVLWLLSDAASYVTGALLPVGGGR